MLLGILEIFPFTWLLALCPLTCWCPICWSDFSLCSLGGFLNFCSGVNLGCLGAICSPFSGCNLGFLGAVCNPVSALNAGVLGGAICNPVSALNVGFLGAVCNPFSVYNGGFLGAICNPCTAFNLEGWCCIPWGICPICWPFNLADQCFWFILMPSCLIGALPCGGISLIGGLPCGGIITLLTFVGDQFLFGGKMTTTAVDFLSGENCVLSSVCENCSFSSLS